MTTGTSGALFAEANISDTNFSDASMPFSNFASAISTDDILFTNAILTNEPAFSVTDINGDTDFTGADLASTNFTATLCETTVRASRLQILQR